MKWNNINEIEPEAGEKILGFYQDHFGNLYFLLNEYYRNRHKDNMLFWIKNEYYQFDKSIKSYAELVASAKEKFVRQNDSNMGDKT